MATLRSRSNMVGLMARACLCLPASPALAEDFRLQFPPIYTMSPNGVNLQTGRYELSQKEFSIGPLTVDLRYTAEVDNDSYVFPPSSTALKNMSNHPANSIARSLRGYLIWSSITDWQGGSFTVIYVQINDTKLQFNVAGTPPNNVSYTAGNLAAAGWRLSRSGTTWTALNKSGDVYTFVDHPAIVSNGFLDKNKVLSNVAFADGRRFDYSYGAAAELRTVISNQGYAVVLDYAAPTQTITACGYNTAVQYVDASSTCAAATLKTSYVLSTVSGKLRLTSVTDVGNATSSLTYVNGMLGCITLPASSTCRIQNVYGPQPGDVLGTEPDQVRKQTTAANNIWLYNYSNPAAGGDMPPLQPGEIRHTNGRMTDPLGNETIGSYANGIVEQIIAPSGTLKYTFNGLCPQTITYPEGNILQVGSSNACNVLSLTSVPKPGPPLASTTRQLVFPPENGLFDPLVCTAASPKLCDKPTAQIDERGNQTDFTYDPLHGGRLTETAPAVNGVRAQTRYTFAQRYAWIKTSAGGYAQASTPVWVMTQKSQCKTGAASGAGCAIAWDEDRTTYDYGPDSGPNNLLLRGIVTNATGSSNAPYKVYRTCYAYDAIGNRISETPPRALLASCP